MRVLLVAHGYPPSGTGGTEVYTQALAQALARTGADVAVLTRTADRLRPEYSVSHDTAAGVHVVRINNTFQACRTFEDSYANPALARVAAEEIARIAPDVAHLQHLTCLSTALPAVLRDLGVPCVMTLNDYWPICHRGQLFDATGQRCMGPFDGGCAHCVPAGALAPPLAYRAGRLARASRMPGAQLIAYAGSWALASSVTAADVRGASISRLEHMRAALEPVALFLAPSQTVEDAFLRFGFPPARLRRCQQGIDLRPFTSIRREPAGTFRVGFAGGLMASKGAHVLLAAAAALPPGRISLDILGDTRSALADERHRERLESWLGAPFVRMLGPVPHERMPDALAAVDAVAVPSLWTENAPFVIREAFAAGAPVVASNLGGMAEMIRGEVDGLLVPPGDVRALSSALDRLATDAALLRRLRAGIRTPYSIDEDAASLRELYAALTGPRSAGIALPTAPASSQVTAIVLNYRTTDQTWLAVRSLEASARRPDRIVVVDNGSGDDAAAALRARLDGTEIVDTGGNLGFAGGCNAGVTRALESGADFVLLVNSDVVLHPGAVSGLLRAAAAHPVAGILGPVLLSREEPDRVASAGIDFDTRSGRMRQRAAGFPLSLLPTGQPYVVDAVSGAVMLIRTDVFRRVGPFDREYFFYFEDIEFCLRARRAGFSSVCTPTALAYHEGGHSIGRRSSRRAYFATRNHLRLAAAVGPGGRVARAARAAFVLALNGAHAALSPEVPLGGGLCAVLRGARDHFRGRYGSD